MARHPPRLPLACYQGAARVFFTTCVRGRVPLFADLHFGRICVAHLLRLADIHDVEVLAYCLMPDHAHALLAGRSARSCSYECFETWKQCTGALARIRLGVKLWQPGIYDRVLRSEDASVGVAAYVLANPVRAGLSSAMGEYPLAGSAVFTMEALAEAMQDGWSPRGVGPTRRPAPGLHMGPTR